MKQILIAFAGMIVLASCEKKQTGSFIVKGDIKNASGKKVFLMEIPYGAPNPVIVDSVTLSGKGSFTLTGGKKTENIYSLAIENGPELLLVNDASEIEVNLDVNDYRNYVVKGSPASQGLHELFEDYGKKDSMLFITVKEIDSLQKANAPDSLISVTRSKKDLQTQDLNNAVTGFITKSPSPAARYYAIGLATRTISPEQLKPLIDESVAKFKNHEGLAGLNKMIASHAAPPQPGFALLNQQAPEINMPDRTGKMVSLSSFRGKYVLVDFWASWCGPCRQENPNVVAAYNAFKDKNFTILGVSLDENKAAWEAAITKDKLTWTHISDLKQWQSAAVPAYQIEGIPFNVLVDPQGKIIAGNLRGEELQLKLGEMLK